MNVLNAWLSIGLLRQGLQVAALASGLILPFAGAPDYTATWDLFFNGVLPAMVPIFLILLYSVYESNELTEKGVDQT